MQLWYRREPQPRRCVRIKSFVPPLASCLHNELQFVAELSSLSENNNLPETVPLMNTPSAEPITLPLPASSAPLHLPVFDPGGHEPIRAELYSMESLEAQARILA